MELTPYALAFSWKVPSRKYSLEVISKVSEFMSLDCIGVAVVALIFELSNLLEVPAMNIDRARRNLLALLFLSECLGASTTPAQNLAEPSAIEAIERGNQAWITGMKSGDPGLIADTYAQDALDCGPAGDCERGRSAILLGLKQRLIRLGRAASATVTSHGSAAQGKFVYEWGVATASFEAGQKIEGHYLTVWQLQKDGMWKIFRNIAIP